MSKPNTPLNVLEAVLNNILDFHEGNISGNLFEMDMQYHYPNLIDAFEHFSELESKMKELQTENEALKDDLKTLQGDYDDLEYNHDELAYQLTQAEYEYESLYEEYQYTMDQLEQEGE